jgi:hypothetical protein
MNKTESKKITAKFSGNCTRCGRVIPSGVTCLWEKGVGIRHENCTVTAVLKNTPFWENGDGAPVAHNDDKKVTVTMGVFRKDGRIYVVKPNREKTAVYAKEIVESPARMTENGEVVDFETRYAPGVVFKLTETDRWDLADAKDFLTKFARCIVCGRHLKAAKSVEQSIGPVCAKYFATTKTACSHEHAPAPVVEDAPETPFQKRMNEAKSNAHKVSQELLDYIKDENEVSRRWQAAGPDRFASIIAEEPEHWALYGIFTLADYKRDQALCDAKEERKASYDWEPLTDEQIAATAKINREFAEIRAQVAQERHDREVYEHHMEEAMVGLL